MSWYVHATNVATNKTAAKLTMNFVDVNVAVKLSFFPELPQSFFFMCLLNSILACDAIQPNLKTLCFVRVFLNGSPRRILIDLVTLASCSSPSLRLNLYLVVDPLPLSLRSVPTLPADTPVPGAALARLYIRDQSTDPPVRESKGEN